MLFVLGFDVFLLFEDTVRMISFIESNDRIIVICFFESSLESYNFISHWLILLF